MTHDKLIDLFADTYTLVKKDAINNNKINIKEVNGIEIFEFKFEDNKITLKKGMDSLSIVCNEDLIFDIPVLEEPQKNIEIDSKDLEFLKRLNDFNVELKNSLNIKSYLTDKDTLSQSITFNKNKKTQI